MPLRTVLSRRGKSFIMRKKRKKVKKLHLADR